MLNRRFLNWLWCWVQYAQTTISYHTRWLYDFIEKENIALARSSECHAVKIMPKWWSIGCHSFIKRGKECSICGGHFTPQRGWQTIICPQLLHLDVLERGTSIDEALSTLFGLELKLHGGLGLFVFWAIILKGMFAQNKALLLQTQ